LARGEKILGDLPKSEEGEEKGGEIAPFSAIQMERARKAKSEAASSKIDSNQKGKGSQPYKRFQESARRKRAGPRTQLSASRKWGKKEAALQFCEEGAAPRERETSSPSKRKEEDEATDTTTTIHRLQKRKKERRNEPLLI